MVCDVLWGKMIHIVSKIDENCCKQTLAGLP